MNGPKKLDPPALLTSTSTWPRPLIASSHQPPAGVGVGEVGLDDDRLAPEGLDLLAQLAGAAPSSRP